VKIKALTLPWRDGAFDTEALDRFVAGHDILSVTQHFFIHDGAPCLVLVLSHRGETPLVGPRPGPPGPSGPSEGPPVVAPEDQPRYEALRRWRNERAKQEGKPPYVLFTNQQMLAIARRDPRTPAALMAVEGVGEAKLAAYGAEVVGLLEAVAAATASASGEGPDGRA
jgi:superfamily II DNA helicase RecQ